MEISHENIFTPNTREPNQSFPLYSFLRNKKEKENTWQENRAI